MRRADAKPETDKQALETEKEQPRHPNYITRIVNMLAYAHYMIPISNI